MWIYYLLLKKEKIAKVGENVVKGARSAKVKVLFQGLHITHIIFMLVYNLKFYILEI
jgi:hypothetical protein